MRTVQELLPALSVKIVKRLLDLGIIVYTILIVVVIVTGGFKIEAMGVFIKATHLYTPLQVLLPLVFLRIFISVEFKNSILMLASLFLCLAALEIVIRVWNPNIAQQGMKQIHEASKFLGWDLIPGASGVGSLGESYRINSSGFRGPEVVKEKQPGKPRIMVIGDSFTFGMGVNHEDAYPTQLQNILDRKKRPSEVINCGVVAHDMWQYNEMLLRKALPYRPDLILLGLYQDDIRTSIPPFTGAGGYAGKNYFEREARDGFMSRFSLWNLLTNVNALIEYKYRSHRGYTYVKRIEERKKKIGPSNPTNEYYRIMAGKKEKLKYAEFAEALERFVETVRDAGADVVVVMIPDSVQLNEPDLQEVNRIVKRMCADIPVPFVDATPFLEPGGDSLYLFPFAAHNNPKGYRIIASAIADKMIELGMLNEHR